MSYLSINSHSVSTQLASPPVMLPRVALHPTKYSSYVLGYHHPRFDMNGVTIYLSDIHVSMSPYHVSVHLRPADVRVLSQWFALFQALLKSYEPTHILAPAPIRNDCLQYPANEITRKIASKEPTHLHLTFKSLYPMDGGFRVVTHIHE